MIELKPPILTKASQAVYSVELPAGHDRNTIALFFFLRLLAPLLASRFAAHARTINFEGKLTKEHPNTLNSICFLLLGSHSSKVNKTKKKTSIKFYLHTVGYRRYFYRSFKLSI